MAASPARGWPLTDVLKTIRPIAGGVSSANQRFASGPVAIPLGSAPLTDRDVEELGRKLEQDASFRRKFDVDPVAAAKAAGMRELGARLEYEIGELIALAGRVARDANRRDELVGALGDPAAALVVRRLGCASNTPDELMKAII